jgi:hypothetical protein
VLFQKAELSAPPSRKLQFTALAKPAVLARVRVRVRARVRVSGL